MNPTINGEVKTDGMVKTETGVMVMKNGKAWGIAYQDGNATGYGWIEPTDAPIHNPRFCKKPTDVTHRTSVYIKDLTDAELVPVTRTTTVELHTDKNKT